MIAPRSTWLALAVAASTLTAGGRAVADPPAGAAKDAPEVIARVDGAPVMREELQRLLESPSERRQLVEGPGGGDDADALRQRALRKLIQRRLILDEARRRSLRVTEKELDDAITSLRRRFPDLRSLAAWMKEQGLDDRSLVETLRMELLAARVRAALVEGVRVGEAELRRYYEAHEEERKRDEVWIQVIAVDERKVAEEILAALREGQDFGALARARSVGKRASRGGDLGWVDVEKLGPPLREAVGTLKPGDARGPLERGSELLIVRLQARRQGKTKTLDEARPELERRLLSAAREEALRAWLATQEKRSKVEILLVKHPSPTADEGRPGKP